MKDQTEYTGYRHSRLAASRLTSPAPGLGTIRILAYSAVATRQTLSKKATSHPWYRGVKSWIVKVAENGGTIEGTLSLRSQLYYIPKQSIDQNSLVRCMHIKITIVHKISLPMLCTLKGSQLRRSGLES